MMRAGHSGWPIAVTATGALFAHGFGLISFDAASWLTAASVCVNGWLVARVTGVGMAAPFSLKQEKRIAEIVRDALTSVEGIERKADRIGVVRFSSLDWEERSAG